MAAWDAETRLAMDSLNNGKGPLPAGDDPAVTELLAHWDELPEEGLANLTAHPVHGPRLEMLRASQDWLEGQLEDAGDCPPAEVLYDFARGPGSVSLERQQHLDVLDHLTHCGECAALVDSLESSPPVPLDSTFDPDSVTEMASIHSIDEESRSQSTDEHEWQAERPIRVMRRWIPIAASLAALSGGLMFFHGSGTNQSLPAYPLLRGEAQGSLLFPRGPVLLGPEDPDLFFEVNPVPEADGYSIMLKSHSGGAFSEGTVIARLSGVTPGLHLYEDIPAGHYTWEAQASVNGLEQPLGARDFEVREDADLKQALTEQDAYERVRSLHAAGYWTDARAAARKLPPGSQRASYLESSPGR